MENKRYERILILLQDYKMFNFMYRHLNSEVHH